MNMCVESKAKLLKKFAEENKMTATDALVRKYKGCRLSWIKQDLKNYPYYPKERHAELFRRLGFEDII